MQILFHFAFVPSFVISSREIFQRKCGLGYEEGLGHYKAVSSLQDTLEKTFKSQTENPTNAAIFRRLDTHLVWGLLGDACPRLLEENEKLQTQLALIPQHTEDCKEIVEFYISPNLEACCFVGMMLRALTFGIRIDGYFMSVELPLKIVSETRRLLLEQQHFAMTPQYAGLLVEFLKVNDMIFPDQILVNNTIVNVVGRSLVDLYILVMLIHHVPYPVVKAETSLPLFLERFVDKQNESISLNGNVYFFRGTHLWFMLKAWRVLITYVPHPRERKYYFNESSSALENFNRLQIILLMIPKRINAIELMIISCAYDCIYYYAKICKIDKDFSKVRGIILDIIFAQSS